MKKCANYALRLCLLVGAVFAASSAFAVDMSELQLDYQYEITGNVFRTYYYFTPAVSGTLMAYGKGILHHYEDENFETEITDVTNGYDENTNHVSSLSVNAGETYYLMYYCMESSYSFYATLLAADVKPEITNVNPAEGAVLYVTDENDGMISWQFNRPVEYGAITFSAGKEGSEVQQEDVECRYTNGFYSVSVRDYILQWLDEGAVEGGDPVVLTIADVHAEGDVSNYYGDDGTVRLTWQCCNIPTKLVSGVWPSTFLSWWDEGDSNGIITLTFDGDLLSFADGQKAHCTIDYGSREIEGGFYEETITYEDNPDKIAVSGSTITVDLTGVRRTNEDMLSASENSFSTIHLTINFVMSADGAYCYTDNIGGVASYQAEINYEDLGDVGDGIRMIETTDEGSATRNNTYNIAGQRVSTPTRGLYIANGKKIYAK